MSAHHLHCNWSAVPDATVDLPKGALANEGPQLDILPGLLLPRPSHLRAPQRGPHMPCRLRQATCLPSSSPSHMRLKLRTPFPISC